MRVVEQDLVDSSGEYSRQLLYHEGRWERRSTTRQPFVPHRHLVLLSTERFDTKLADSQSRAAGRQAQLAIDIKGASRPCWTPHLEQSDGSHEKQAHGANIDEGLESGHLLIVE
eukprot:scaffold25405_cov33-Tisochrysis_lutea.AAC.3